MKARTLISIIAVVLTIVLMINKPILGFFLLIIVSTVIYGSYTERKKKQKKQANRQAFYTIKDFTPDFKYINEFGGIALDTERKKIAFVNSAGGNSTHFYSDLYACEIVEDGNVTFRKESKSLAGRALVGAVILGSVGAILGGVTAKNKEKKEVSTLNLKLYLESFSSPKHIKFFDALSLTSNTKKTITTNDNLYWSQYQSVKNTAIEWTKRINHIIQSNK